MLQGYLDMMGIPYSTCSTLCEALTFDKYTCTNYLQGFWHSYNKSDYSVPGEAIRPEAILKAVGLTVFCKTQCRGIQLWGFKGEDSGRRWTKL